MPTAPYRGCFPKISPSAFVAPNAWVIGDVALDDDSSVFFGATLRGDVQPIRVGLGSNIQEQAVLHASHGMTPCLVGCHVTVGHGAVIHGCTVGDETLVGIGTTILDRAVIGKRCIIGAHSLVTAGTVIPDGHLVLGSPAKVVRPLTPEEISSLRTSADRYIELQREYRGVLVKLGS